MGYITREQQIEGDLTWVTITVTPDGFKAIEEWRIAELRAELVIVQHKSAAAYKKVEELQEKLSALLEGRT